MGKGTKSATTAITVVNPSDEGAAAFVLRQPRQPSQDPLCVYLASLAPTSRAVQRSSLNTIARMVNPTATAETFPWSQLRYSHVAAIRVRLAEGYAPSSANRMLAAIKGVIREAWRLGLLSAEDYHRAIDVKAVRGSRVAKGRMVSAGEVAALAADCSNGTMKGARDSAILACMFAGALRRAEICNLDSDSVTDGVLRVLGKGNKERTVPLANGARKAVEAWIAVREANNVEPGPLFPPFRRGDAPQWGKRMSPGALRVFTLALAERAGVEPFNPHDGRRTTATNMIDAGADLFAVQAALGHARVETTQRYDLRGERAKADALSKVHFPYYAPKEATK